MEYQNMEITDEDIQRLSAKAGTIVGILNHMFTSPEGIDIYRSLLYAAGLAGFVCHRAVKETDPGAFVVGCDRNCQTCGSWYRA